MPSSKIATLNQHGPRGHMQPSDWIWAGFRALVQGGPQALRVEPIARELGTTKGSFYWHFADLAALRAAMLEAWEQVATTDITAAIQHSGLPPRAQLLLLVDKVSVPPDAEAGGDAVEPAIRDWGRTDRIVRQVPSVAAGLWFQFTEQEHCNIEIGPTSAVGAVFSRSPPSVAGRAANRSVEQATRRIAMSDTVAPLRNFVLAMTQLMCANRDESYLLTEGRLLLARLIEVDAWLPPAFAEPRTDRYAQYLLHCDPLERFSVVSFVWGPGQKTPVHDHTVWGLVGVLRGAERCDEYALQGGKPVATGQHHVMQRGAIEAVSPTVGDWHRVSHGWDKGPAVSIHVYGANIGAVRRHRLDDSGAMIDFVSGYDNAVVPNLWDRSACVRVRVGP